MYKTVFQNPGSIQEIIHQKNTNTYVKSDFSFSVIKNKLLVNLIGKISVSAFINFYFFIKNATRLRNACISFLQLDEILHKKITNLIKNELHQLSIVKLMTSRRKKTIINIPADVSDKNLEIMAKLCISKASSGEYFVIHSHKIQIKQYIDESNLYFKYEVINI